MGNFVVSIKIKQEICPKYNRYNIINLPVYRHLRSPRQSIYYGSVRLLNTGVIYYKSQNCDIQVKQRKGQISRALSQFRKSSNSQLYLVMYLLISALVADAVIVSVSDFLQDQMYRLLELSYLYQLDLSLS